MNSAKYRAAHQEKATASQSRWRKRVANQEKSNIPLEKRCANCQQVKSSGEFFPEKYSASGLRPWCKHCCSKYQRSATTKARLRNWYKSYVENPEVRERIRAKGRERASTPKYKDYRKHYEATDKCKETRNRYRKSERRKIAVRKYKASPKGKITVLKYVHKRRSLKAQAVHIPYSEADLAAHFHRFGDVCAYCGAKKRLTIDHFIPLSKGGLDGLSNFVPACSFCNASKQFREPQKWYEAQPFYSQKRWNLILTILNAASNRG
ncbi:MAG TPA: HNH endonuclease [Pyrinomonadaceae bacterium]